RRTLVKEGNSCRCQKGNMLVLTLGITAGLMIALVFFALNYTRFMGSHNEQRTCIEAASLAAARDLSRVVINDRHFGFVGLSDNPPASGTQMIAPDNYYMQVESINTIVGTIRMDMIIADQLNDPTMKALAAHDFQYVQAAVNSLNSALNNAATGGNAQDID